jgi:hypothetical protein
MASQKLRAGAEAGPSLFSGGNTTEDSATHTRAQRKPHLEALVYETEGIRVVPVKGRVAWALRHLIDAGPTGCTPITTPGPRWSHYVWCLRQHGIRVATIHESHGGPFAGTHARYVLRSKVVLREPVEAGGRAA